MNNENLWNYGSLCFNQLALAFLKPKETSKCDTPSLAGRKPSLLQVRSRQDFRSAT